MNLLPLIGFRTTEAYLAASTDGLIFYGMLTLEAPLGMHLSAGLGHVRAESVPQVNSSANSEATQPN